MKVEEALIILDKVLNKPLNNVQELVFCHCWKGRTYWKIAQSANYDTNYIKNVGAELWKLLSEALGEEVTKSNFRAVIRQHEQKIFLQTPSSEVLMVTPLPETDTKTILNNHQDWGEAIDVTAFYGRSEELKTLQEWIIKDKCRLIALLGMGGMGKTALAVKIAQQIQSQFDYLVWKSLRNAPHLEEILKDIIQFLSAQQKTHFPDTIESLISQIINYLRSSRCLLILDNVESILQSGKSSGYYQENYEEYGQLIRRIAQEPHQSCLLLTSREQLKELSFLEGKAVHCLHLKGLKPLETQEVFLEKGSFSGSDNEWKLLNEHYAGNPLALKMVAPVIQSFFDNNIAQFLGFLSQGILVFDDIRDLLERQFDRLADSEKEVMYWLMVNREPVSLLELQEDFVPNVSPNQLLESIASLERRSLIEKTSTGFTQQPVVMEYITERLIEQIVEEIMNEQVDLLNSHALIKANSKEYVIASQNRVILQPIAQKLENIFSSKEEIEAQLKRILLKLQQEFAGLPGYGAGNLINLLHHFQINLANYDFSHLTIWQADLRQVNLDHVNFADADLEKSVFAETLGIVFSVAFSPDGKLLATGDVDGKIRLWRVVDGKQLSTLQSHSSWVCSVAWSPNGQTLASGSHDHTVKLWDVNTGQCLKVLQDHVRPIWSVSFSLDGKILASGSHDHTVRLWDVDTGQCLKVLQSHTDQVWSVAWSPKGTILASASADQTVKLWDVDTGQCLKVLQGHTDKIWSVSFNCEGQILATGSYDKTVRFWNVDTGQCFKVLQGHIDQVWSVSFSREGQILASGSADQTVRLWDVQTGQCLKVLQGHTSTILSVNFSPKSQIIASGSDDQTVRLWEAKSNQCLKVLRGHNSWLTSVVFSPNSQILASGSSDQTVRLWDVQTGQCLKMLQGHTDWIYSVAFSPDSHFIAASGSVDKTVRLWIVETGQCLKILRGHISGTLVKKLVKQVYNAYMMTI